MRRTPARAALAAALALAALGALPAAAPAVLFPAESIDGPSADILRAADVDVARDGGAAVAYLKRNDGQPHVWVSRMVGGAWGPPEQLDVGQPSESRDPHVAVADGGRAVATWINAGRLWSSVRSAGDAAWSQPIPVHDGVVQSQSLDMSIHGIGYVAFAVGAVSRDVRAARMAGGAWTLLGGVLDTDQARDAGVGGGPQVVAASDGTAMAAWEEVGTDGQRRVFVRRALRDRLSAHPATASLPELDGRPGGDARNPDIGLDEDTSHGWVALEQEFLDGGVNRSRVFGRPIVGVGLEDPLVLDGQQFGTGVGAINVDIDVVGRERALVVSETAPGAATMGAVLQNVIFGSIGPIDSAQSAGAADPAVGESSNGEGVFAWFEDPGPVGAPGVIGRFFNRDDALEGEVQLANPEFGPAVPTAGIDVSADRLNDTAIAFVQGASLERRLVVAHHDRMPRAVQASTSTQAWQSNRRPRITWARVTDLWGLTGYRVEVFGQQVPTVSPVFEPSVDLPDGSHPWRVVTVDRRGQEAIGAERRLNIDGTPPTAVLVTTGRLRKGRAIRFQVRDDPPPVLPPAVPASRTSGVSKFNVSFGDGTRATGTREASHVYRRKGNYTVRFVATDRAGNSQIVKIKIKVTNK